MTSAEITQLRIRAVDALKARGVAHPMPDQILLEMKRMPAEKVKPLSQSEAIIREMFSGIDGAAELLKGMDKL